MKFVIVAAAAALLAGCAGKQEYIRPTPAGAMENTKIIDRPRSEVWDKAVPQLGKQFFVINNLDKSSGLINLSYSGDPAKYIDCGRVISFVKNAQGERTYNFAGAQAQMEYEMMVDGTTLIFLNRRVDLDGRVNLIFEDVDGQKTRVTANTRYAVKRDFGVRDVHGNSRSFSDSVNFNSNGRAQFAERKVIEGAECRPTGDLEREILNSIN
jgi:hypothetical protein